MSDINCQILATTEVEELISRAHVLEKLNISELTSPTFGALSIINSPKILIDVTN